MRESIGSVDAFVVASLKRKNLLQETLSRNAGVLLGVIKRSKYLQAPSICLGTSGFKISPKGAGHGKKNRE
jgi:hypothetical protein